MTLATCHDALEACLRAADEQEPPDPKQVGRCAELLAQSVLGFDQDIARAARAADKLRSPTTRTIARAAMARMPFDPEPWRSEWGSEKWLLDEEREHGHEREYMESITAVTIAMIGESHEAGAAGRTEIERTLMCLKKAVDSKLQKACNVVATFATQCTRWPSMFLEAEAPTAEWRTVFSRTQNDGSVIG